MTKFPAALALCLGLVLSACYPPTTSHPVGVAGKPDPALTGTWRGTNEDGKPGYFHFLTPSDGAITVLIAEGGPKAEDWNVASVTASRLGANRFFNARLVSSNGKPEEGAPAGTVPILAKTDAKGQMSLFMMDETMVKAAITGGKIKGAIGQGQMGDAVITADAATLDKFLQTPAGLALFAKPFFVLKKVE
jgi:hypothetical protein